MRKFFSFLILLAVLGATAASAHPNDPGEGRNRDRAFDRIVRFVKTLFHVQANDDLPRPPLP